MTEQLYDQEYVDSLLKEISEKNNFIEVLKTRLEEEQSRSKILRDRIHQLEMGHKHKVDEMHIREITNLKTFKYMLIPYTTESMTHREKAYFGSKINQMLDTLIENKISAHATNLNLPF